MIAGDLIRNAAVEYAAIGVPIFPCREKRPLVSGGFKSATVDLAQIADWFDAWPDLQIAAPTGSKSGIFGLDLDSAAAIALAETWNLPDTKIVETRPGRIQKWFVQPPGVTSRCTASVIAPDVDTRGDGGYIVLPPSIHHQSRTRYRVVHDVPLAPVPDFLLDPMAQHTSSSKTSSAIDKISKGRHRALISFAGSLRNRGLNEAAILVGLRLMNQERCEPPLDEVELPRLARWAATKTTGSGIATPGVSRRIELRCFEDIEEERVTWLWQRVVPRGKQTIFSGAWGIGKSVVTLDIAARITTGDKMPDGTPGIEGDVLILSAEDAVKDTIKPRLRLAGADMKRIHEIRGITIQNADGTETRDLFSFQRDLELLRASIAENPQIALLIVDPLSAHLGDKADSWKDSSIRGILGPVSRLAEETGVSVLSIMHPKKGESSAQDKIIGGTVAFGANARSVYGFIEDEFIPGRTIMLNVKANLAARGTAFAYRLRITDEIPSIVWEPDSFTYNPEAAFGRERAEKNKVQLTAEWLRELLASGPVLAEQVEIAAKESRTAWRTVQRAKEAVNIASKRKTVPGPWYWCLPGQELSE